MSSFKQFAAHSLKTELRLKDNIEEKIKDKGGKTFPIEERMLASIQNYINVRELTEEEINSSKDLPNFKSMLQSIGENDLNYTVIMKIGSHAIHGTWSNLLKYFVEFDCDKVFPKDLGNETHCNQYMSVSVYILKACMAYIEYSIVDDEIKKRLTNIIQIDCLELVLFIKMSYHI